MGDQIISISWDVLEKWDKISKAKPPHIYTYEPPFRKSWICPCSHRNILMYSKVRKRAKIRNTYNQAPHLTQDTNGKVTSSQQNITNESLEISPFPASDHKASTNRRAWKHNKTRQKYHKWSTKEALPWNLLILLPLGKGNFGSTSSMAIDWGLEFYQLHVDIVRHACAIGEKTVSTLYFQVIRYQ